MVFADPTSIQVISADEGNFVPGVIIAGTGIDPTGAVSSKTAILALLAAAATSAAVYFPAGIYNADGIDFGARTIMAYGAKLTGSVAGSICSVSGDGSKVKGLEVVNNYGAGCIGLDVSAGTSNVELTDGKFGGTNAQGLNVANPGIKHITATSCRFDGVNYGVLTNAGAGTGAYDLQDVKVIGCTFLNIGGDAIEFNHPQGVGGSPYLATDFAVIGCYISSSSTSSGAGFGVGAAGVARLRILANTFVGCTQQAIHLEDKCRDATISGNSVEGGGTLAGSSFPAGIFVADTENFIVTGNTVHGVAGSGIWAAFDASHQCYDGVITGNTVRGCSGTGIRAYFTTAGDSTVSGNTSIGNGGDGIDASGPNMLVTGNTCKNNAGYGIRGTKFPGMVVTGNTSQGNTGGNYQPQAYPQPIAGESTTGTFAYGGAGNIGPFNLLSLGKMASGRLSVSVDKGGDNVTNLFKLDWDGTTLTTTLVGGVANGGMGATVALSMSGQTLQGTVFNAGGAATARISAQLDGLFFP